MLLKHLDELGVRFRSLRDNFDPSTPTGRMLRSMLAVFAEFFCSVLLITGTATRLACLPLLIAMLTAAFVHHGADSFAMKEKALLYALGYAVLLLTGSGPWSVEAWFGPRLKAWWRARNLSPMGGLP